MTIYTVRPNDTVDSIAALYGISPQSIIYDNQLAYPYPLAIGQAQIRRPKIRPFPPMSGGMPTLSLNGRYWKKHSLTFQIFLFSPMDLHQKAN